MHTVSPKEKARHAIHRTAQMGRNEPFGKMDSVLRKLFSGKGFAKPRLMFLKFGGIEFPPRRRVREECGAGVLDFCEGAIQKKKYQAQGAGYVIASLEDLTLRGENAAIIATYRAVNGI
jgi:hypothetical protein